MLLCVMRCGVDFKLLACVFHPSTEAEALVSWRCDSGCLVVMKIKVQKEIVFWCLLLACLCFSCGALLSCDGEQKSN